MSSSDCSAAASVSVSAAPPVPASGSAPASASVSAPAAIAAPASTSTFSPAAAIAAATSSPSLPSKDSAVSDPGSGASVTCTGGGSALSGVSTTASPVAPSAVSTAGTSVGLSSCSVASVTPPPPYRCTSVYGLGRSPSTELGLLGQTDSARAHGRWPCHALRTPLTCIIGVDDRSVRAMNMLWRIREAGSTGGIFALWFLPDIATGDGLLKGRALVASRN